MYIFIIIDLNVDRESEEGCVFCLLSILFVFFLECCVVIVGMNKFIKLVGCLDLDIIYIYMEFLLGLLGKWIVKKYYILFIYIYYIMYVDYLYYIVKGKILIFFMVGKMIKLFCDSYDVIIILIVKVRYYLEE